MNVNRPSVSVIGTGAVGSALIDFFEVNLYPLRSVWNRSGGILSHKNGVTETVTSMNPENEEQSGELIFITVPDDSISGVAQSLSTKEIAWKKKIAVHCSGNLSSDVLEPLKKKGASVVSMHPIQTFTTDDKSDRFQGIFVSVEGDEQAKVLLKGIIQEMGANHLDVSAPEKRALHVAAVFASNYMVTLFHEAENILQQANITAGITVLKPLIQQTAENIFRKGTVDALTGPASRGDTESIRKHLEQIRDDNRRNDLYKLLGSIAADITEKRGGLSTSQLLEMKTLFEKKEVNGS